MKAKLGSPVLLLFLLSGSVYWGVGMARSQSNPADDVAESPQEAGRRIVANCRETLENVPSLEVELSQQVLIHGQQLNGTGRYLQAGQGGERTRLELKLSAGSEVASLLQINNGRFVYTQLHTPQTQQLTQVDLQRAKQELGYQPVATMPAPRGANTAGGGLLALIRALERDFDFGTAQQVSWGDQQVWQLGGRWKDQALRQYFGIPENPWLDAEAMGKLPEHIPTHVEIVVGLDPQLPYFPYRIVFLRQTEKNGETHYQTLSRMETSGIRQQIELPDSDFDFVPGDEEVIDVTHRFVAEQQAASASVQR